MGAFYIGLYVTECIVCYSQIFQNFQFEFLILEFEIQGCVQLFVSVLSNSKSNERIFVKVMYVGKGLAKGRSDKILEMIPIIFWNTKKKKKIFNFHKSALVEVCTLQVPSILNLFLIAK